VQTYRELFLVPEFKALFASVSVQVAAGTMSGLALATLVFSRTGSPLLAALSLFGASFAQVVGALTLLSAADRVPPRVTLAGLALVFAVGTSALAIPGMPVWVMLAIILLTGLINSPGGGVRWGLLSEVLPADGYVLGRSVMNMSVSVMQIVGFAVGGALVAVISARNALLLAASLELVAALMLWVGLSSRAARATGRPSVQETWRVDRELWSDPVRRNVYLALWVPNGLVVGCEALFVPYAGESAGTLFIAGALGMLAGDALAGRVLPPTSRARFITPLRMLLAAPYLLFAVALPLPVAMVTVAVASMGFGAGLLLQERLIAATPADMRGQALGLHSSGMLTMQAVGATCAGVIAEYLSASTAMVAMAALSLTATLLLTPGLSRPVHRPVDQSV
jgi:predicted MFS family arabinose efflux permease